MEVVLAVVTLLNELNLVGPEIPLSFVKGAIIDIGIEVVDILGAPVNIFGRTYTAKIGPSGGAAIATFTQVDTNLAQGLVNLTLTTGPIAALVAGQFRWVAWENGTRFLWRGPVTITDPDVT